MAALRDALTELFVVCLLSAAADALFDDSAQGLRLVCGLSVALSAGRLAAAILK